MEIFKKKTTYFFSAFIVAADDVCAIPPNGTPDKEKHNIKMECKARKERPSL